MVHRRTAPTLLRASSAKSSLAFCRLAETHDEETAVMNNTVYYDTAASDEVRRQQLFDGQLFVFSPRASILNFVAFARSMIEEAFGDLDPRTAQDEMEVEDYAELLGRLKPSFIHHPESKRHLTTILEDLGCDPHQTYFDVPRMRISPPASPMPGTRTATPGIRRRPARPTGGCRSTSSTPTTPWHSTRATGASQ
jgi:hypothetical protein